MCRKRGRGAPFGPLVVRIGETGSGFPCSGVACGAGHFVIISPTLTQWRSVGTFVSTVYPVFVRCHFIHVGPTSQPTVLLCSFFNTLPECLLVINLFTIKLCQLIMPLSSSSHNLHLTFLHICPQFAGLEWHRSLIN